MMTLRREIKMMFFTIIYVTTALVSPHLSSPVSMKDTLLRLETILHRNLRGSEIVTGHRYSKTVEAHENHTKSKDFSYPNESKDENINTNTFNNTLAIDKENRTRNLTMEIGKVDIQLTEIDNNNTNTFNDTPALDKENRTRNSTIEMGKFDIQLTEIENKNISEPPIYIEISRQEDSNDRRYEQEKGPISESYHKNIIGYVLSKGVRSDLATTSSQVINSRHSDVKRKRRQATQITINPQNKSGDMAVELDFGNINNMDNKDDSSELEKTDGKDDYVGIAGFVNGIGKINETSGLKYPERTGNYKQSNPAVGNLIQLEGTADNQYNIVNRGSVNGDFKTNDNSGLGNIKAKGYSQQDFITTIISQHQSVDTSGNQRDDIAYRGNVIGKDAASDLRDRERKGNYQEPILIINHEQQTEGSANNDHVVNRRSVNDTNTRNDISQLGDLHGGSDHQQSSQTTTERQNPAGFTTSNKDEDSTYSEFISKVNVANVFLKSENYQERNLINSTDLGFTYKNIVKEKASTVNRSNTTSEQSENDPIEAQSPAFSFRHLVNGEYGQNFNESDVQEMNNTKNISTIKEETAVTAKSGQLVLFPFYKYNNTGKERAFLEVTEGFVNGDHDGTPYDLNDNIISDN